MNRLRRSRSWSVVGLGALVFAVVAVVVSSASAARTTATRGGAAATGSVALLLPSLGQYRWDNQDRPYFIDKMKALAPGAKVIYSNAQDSPARQLQQAQAAITNGAKVLVLSPVNDQDAAKIAQEAKAAKVTVIAYARPIQKAPISYFVGLDLYQTGVGLGKFWAKQFHAGDHVAILKGDPGDANVPAYMRGLLSIVNPIAKSGKITIVADVYTPQWSTVNAQREMEQILTKENNNVQDVIPLNDSLALGVIAALTKQGLAGKVPVSGGDASIPALQDMLKGTQLMSTYFPIKDMADHAAAISAALLAGTKPAASLFNTKLNNGLVTVPGYGVSALSITKATIGKVISDGSVKKSQVCKGIAAGVGPC
jgi:D-xylose transport system substrate-binding protein